MSRSLLLRKAEKEDFKALAKFHNSLLTNARTEDVWEWEYQELYHDKAVLYVATSHDLIIGSQGIIPIPICVNDRILLSGKSESTLIDKTSNENNIFLELYSKVMEESFKKRIDVLWGITFIPEIFELLFDFKAYNCIFSAVLNYRFETVNKRMKLHLTSVNKIVHFFISILARIHCRLLKFWIYVLTCRIKNEKYELHEETNDNDLKVFFKKVRDRNDHVIHILQNSDFLNWRFVKNPKNRKFTYFAYSGGEILAVMYLTLKEDRLYIDEFLFLDKKSAHFLIRRLISVCRFNNAGMIYYLGNRYNKINIEVYRLLRFYGFIKTISKNPHFIIKDFSLKEEHLLKNINNWYITELYSEGI